MTGSKYNSTAGLICKGFSAPRRALNSSVDGEVARLDLNFAGFDLGQIEQVVDQFQQAFGRAPDIVDLSLLLAVDLAVQPVEQHPRQAP